ncbi:MAG: putative toxin-antitoxin system toxin component, PIN family [Deltaproteobacteria bacterium]|nr:putative toxin-antitoxin system toxin component, PIN family [Deltaproteobacteria bacterium]
MKSLTKNRRFVFDTNIFVSALFFKRSDLNALIRNTLKNGMLLLSLPVSEEIVTVLWREKFSRYEPLEKIDYFWDIILDYAKWVTPQQKIFACRDPKDNKFLELAVAGQADFLITLDKDLLILNPFRGIPILAPHEFLRRDF